MKGSIPQHFITVGIVWAVALIAFGLLVAPEIFSADQPSEQFGNLKLIGGAIITVVLVLTGALIAVVGEWQSRKEARANRN